MNQRKFILKSIFGFSVLAILLLAGCAEERQDSLYPPDEELEPAPVVNSLEPEGSWYAGVGTITINGENFMPVEPYSEYNLVAFDENLAEVVDATQTRLVVKSPKYIADSIEVKIATRESLFSEPVLYALKAAVDTTFGNLKAGEVVYGICADGMENVYVFINSSAKNYIMKISPEGETSVHIDNISYLRANAMRTGPQQNLYTAVAAGRVKVIYKYDDAGQQSVFTSLPGIPRAMDFDQNDNLWVTSDDQLVKVDPQGSAETMATLDLPLQALRVYDNTVYTSGYDENSGEQKLWSIAINDGQNIGEPQVVIDGAAAQWLDGVKINAITFSAEGEMYLGTNGSPDALFRYNLGAEAQEVVFPGLVAPNLYAMVWGEDVYVYASQINADQTASNVLKIDLGQLGASYYGRD
ncbi:MAG: hypothetical protein GF313_05205 [Caldithrix sp.]|nr:hypothetical protein [Caldithrix sp.]